MNRFPPDRHEHDPRGSCRGWRTSRLRRAAPIVVILIASSFHPGRLTAQEARDLASLRDAAVRSDPRTSRLALLEEATNLRLANLAAEWLPSLNLGATASYQSEVPAVPIDRPDLEIPVPPMQRYESAIEAEQLIYDGGVLRGRRAIEEARLHTEQARIQAELYPLRSEVNEAFFRALLLQETIDEIDGLIADLDARLGVVRTRVREGAALPGDTAVIRAEMLRAMMSRNEAAASHRAALAVLSDLTGVQVSAEDSLLIPNLEALVSRTRATVEGAPDSVGAAPRLHPQYTVYDALRNDLESRSRALDADRRPRLSAFGQWSYGRPGLEQFTSAFHDYWMAGVRVRWQPWDWGSARREREILETERRAVDAEEAAFTNRLDREVRDLVETMERLEASVALDEELIRLREQLERQAGAQLNERAITPAEYVDARTDLDDARRALRRHQVELAAARARYLTILGVPID